MRQGGGGDAAITDLSNNNARKTKMLVRLLQGPFSGRESQDHNERKHRELNASGSTVRRPLSEDLRGS